MVDQKKQCELRSVRLNKKHALAAENAPCIDAVKPAGKMALGIPCLDAVNDAFLMKLRVNANKVLCYPGASALSFTDRCLAAAYHGTEVAIDRKSEFVFAAFFCKAARNVQIRELEYGPLLRTEPRQRHTIDVPGKDPFSVRFLNILSGERLTE